MSNWKLPEVSTKYGAPMGRHSYGEAGQCPPRSISLRKLPMDASGAYDTGGAYWGTGDTIWVAQCKDPEYFATCRARTRQGAIEALCLEHGQL